MRKLIAAFVIVCCLGPLSQATGADDSSRRVRKLGQTLFELQQDYLTLKEDYENQKKQWQAQQEEFNLLIKNLLVENQKLIEESKILQQKVYDFEETLESAENVRIARDINEINTLLKSIVLTDIDDQQTAEPLILKIINDAESNIPRDLLVLYLARLKEKGEHWEEGLGYYGTLVTEFPDSAYIYRSILSMSDIFGKLGKHEEQSMLLDQLIYLDEENPYSVLAKKRLADLETADKNEMATEESAELVEPVNLSSAAEIEVDRSPDVSGDADMAVLLPGQRQEIDTDISSDSFPFDGEGVTDSGDSYVDPIDSALLDESQSDIERVETIREESLTERLDEMINESLDAADDTPKKQVSSDSDVKEDIDGSGDAIQIVITAEPVSLTSVDDTGDTFLSSNRPPIGRIDVSSDSIADRAPADVKSGTEIESEATTDSKLISDIEITDNAENYGDLEHLEIQGETILETNFDQSADVTIAESPVSEDVLEASSDTTMSADDPEIPQKSAVELTHANTNIESAIENTSGERPIVTVDSKKEVVTEESVLEEDEQKGEPETVFEDDVILSDITPEPLADESSDLPVVAPAPLSSESVPEDITSDTTE